RRREGRRQRRQSRHAGQRDVPEVDHALDCRRDAGRLTNGAGESREVKGHLHAKAGQPLSRESALGGGPGPGDGGWGVAGQGRGPGRIECGGFDALPGNDGPPGDEQQDEDRDDGWSEYRQLDRRRPAVGIWPPVHVGTSSTLPCALCSTVNVRPGRTEIALPVTVTVTSFPDRRTVTTGSRSPVPAWSRSARALTRPASSVAPWARAALTPWVAVA